MTAYLVTGATGFIGARVAALLLESGAHVIGVDDLNTSYDVRLKEWRLARLSASPHFTFHTLDVGDGAAVNRLWAALPPLEAVFNLAARAGVRQSLLTPHIYYHTNLNGTLNLLEACRHHGPTKFILASTSSLYGAENPMPYREDGDTDHPLSPYTASKKAAETLCHAYHHLYGLDISIVRYFTVYGPAGRPDMSVFRFTQWISEERPVVVFGDGSQLRDFTYIDDIARGTIAAARPLGYEAINLGSDRPIALIDVIRTIERLVGKPAQITFQPFHNADMRGTWADVRKAHALLGWQPNTSFEEGAARAVAWYTEHRAWASTIATAE